MPNVAAVHEDHRDVAAGGARAAVFGMSDGLVTNVSLILGFAGAHPAPSVVRLAGLAGLVAGACSMATGEWTSMQAQRELLDYELDVERAALAEHPEAEVAELTASYIAKGLDPELSAQLSAAVMANPTLALETHAREELGIDPSAIGSPWRAAVASFVMFALGAFLPLIPWLFGSGRAAVIGSICLGALGALGLGAVLGRLTGRSMVIGALRLLALTTFAAAVTYGVGRLVGSA